MSLDLRVVPQPYPDKAAFVSISPYLTDGWAAWTSNEALALIDGNTIVYSVRLRPTSPSSFSLTTQLPNELLPVGNPYLFAFIDGVPAAAKVQNRAILIPPEYRGETYPADIVIATSILPRRPA